MFSRSDADELREQLSQIDFTTPAAPIDALVRYQGHYGLQLDEPGNEVVHHIGTFASGGYKLVCQYFALPAKGCKGCAFLLHGYYDHTGLFGHLIRHCLQQGYSVVMFDMPGHGLSTGKVASIGSFREYCQALQDCCALAKPSVPVPWLLMGQSTGAATIMDSLLNTPLANDYSFTHHILLCPLLYPVNVANSTLLFHLLKYFIKSLPRNFARNSHDQEFLQFLKSSDALQSRELPVSWVAAMMEYQQRFKQAEASEVALHIVQGTGDGTVDWQRNLQLIQKKFPRATSYLIDDAKHHLVNESAEYREKIFATVSSILHGTAAD